MTVKMKFNYRQVFRNTTQWLGGLHLREKTPSDYHDCQDPENQREQIFTHYAIAIPTLTHKEKGEKKVTWHVAIDK